MAQFKAFIHPHPDAPEEEDEYTPHTPLEDPPEETEVTAQEPLAPTKVPKAPDPVEQCTGCPLPPPPSAPTIGLGYVVPGGEILWLAGGAWLLGAVTGALIAHSFSKGKVAQVCPMK